MALTNAEKQKRWRERRNSRAGALTGTPKEVADGILRTLGAQQAAKVARALKVRLRNLRPDCPACQGTGFVKLETRTACDRPLGFTPTVPCDCSGLWDSTLPPRKPVAVGVKD
jgi:hypothetical protein